MPTTTTTAQTAASSAVDEAVRIAAEGSRRTAESAQAAVQATRTYFDQVNQVSGDLFKIWASTADAALQSAFEFQNAAFANGQAAFETWTSLSKDGLRRWAEVTRQTQATTLKAYQANVKLFQPSL
jgi:hypothetical protein